MTRNTSTPAFRIETVEVTLDATSQTSRKAVQVMAWNVKGRHGATSHGAPTVANLEKFVEAWEASFNQLDGVNHQAGRIVCVTFARIVRQATGDVMAEFKPAPFQVVNI